MENITVKEVLDFDGDFSHIELIQGKNVLKIHLGRTSLDSGRKNYKWETIKKIIDAIVERRLSARTEK